MKLKIYCYCLVVIHEGMSVSKRIDSTEQLSSFCFVSMAGFLFAGNDFLIFWDWHSIQLEIGNCLSNLLRKLFRNYFGII